MRVALAQLNQTVGDFAGNADRIVAAAETAARDGATVPVTPELSLTGYPPEDLLLRRGFYAKCGRRRRVLASRTVRSAVTGDTQLLQNTANKPGRSL